MGLLDLMSGVTPPLGDRLHALRGWVPLTVPQASAMLVTAAGLALVLLGGGVRRGHRRAWALSMALLVLSAILHVIKGLDVEEAVVALGLAGYLAARRDCFPAPSCPQKTRAGLATIVAGAAVATLTGAVAVALNPVEGARAGIGWSLAAAAERLVGVRDLVVPGRVGHFLTPSMEAMGLATLAAAAWLAFRPIVSRRATTNTIDPEVRAIVARHGRGTLDYFALRDDKAHLRVGDSVVAYSVQGGICLVSPDPIGPVEDRAKVWSELRRFAESHGWPVAVLGVSEDWLPIYEADGMGSLYVGDEALVDPSTFKIDGGKAKGLRHAVNRAVTAGYTFELRDPSCLEPELEAALRRVLTESRRGGVERGYAMTLGRVFDPADRGLLLGIAFEPSGEPAAFCQFVPAPGINGWSLDLMRRSDRPHPNSISDFVVVSTILAIRDWGATGLALNFATLRAVLAGEAGDGWSTKIQALVARQLSGSMQIESLWKHNAKYRPAWQPRFAVYDGAENIVPSALAVARAESFWELPVIGRFLQPAPDAEPAPDTEPEPLGV
jgi:lysylphosphatidylglycerol synthetase-like protein (DUF2156 family)